MSKMENFIAVQRNTDGIIGKFLYYSTSNILIERPKAIEIGQSIGLPKFKPARESKSGIYRTATSSIKERVEVRDGTGMHTYRIYCRDNKKDVTHIYRELVKETLNSKTNEYKKLANIIFDKETETVYFDNEVYDADIDVYEYCRKAVEMYERLCTCYTTDHIESVVQDQLNRMQANKISIHGNLYFIPNPYLPLLNILEDYISAISKHNLNNGLVMSNSMFVVDDERQREKMTEEFYVNYKRDIEFYQERVQHFIDNGCESKVIIERWIKKIQALQQKKKTYEDVLKRQLDALNSDYAMLQMQSEELQVRTIKGQMQLKAA